jgi:hypothetical protein
MAHDSGADKKRVALTGKTARGVQLATTGTRQNGIGVLDAWA